jgi:Asp-tRNA(Asn)/Glu-tRNA(Gln) amidotransferase A subunit family amidase
MVGHDEARAVAAQPISGPFGGVPFLLKDLFASYAGVRLTHPSRVGGGLWTTETQPARLTWKK